MSLLTRIQERYENVYLIVLQEDQIMCVVNMNKYYILSPETLDEIGNNIMTCCNIYCTTDTFTICKWNIHVQSFLLPEEAANNPITHIFPVFTLLKSIDSRVLLDKAWDTPRISGKLIGFPWKDVEIRYIEGS